MKNERWTEDLYLYRMKPAPPKMEDFHVVELRLKFTDDNSVTYEYCADHNNDWGEIRYFFGDDDYDVNRYIYADRKGDFYFAAAGE